ncbi:hypothetical protein ABIF90_001078 [Bradyrhizobium japonicum]
MKIAIVIAGLIVVAVAALVAIQPEFLKPASLAQVKKSDIFGFSPGMTFEETNKLVTQRHTTAADRVEVRTSSNAKSTAPRSRSIMTTSTPATPSGASMPS